MNKHITIINLEDDNIDKYLVRVDLYPEDYYSTTYDDFYLALDEANRLRNIYPDHRVRADCTLQYSLREEDKNPTQALEQIIKDNT